MCMGYNQGRTIRALRLTRGDGILSFGLHSFPISYQGQLAYTRYTACLFFVDWEVLHTSLLLRTFGFMMRRKFWLVRCIWEGIFLGRGLLLKGELDTDIGLALFVCVCVCVWGGERVGMHLFYVLLFCGGVCIKNVLDIRCGGCLGGFISSSASWILYTSCIG